MAKEVSAGLAPGAKEGVDNRALRANSTMACDNAAARVNPVVQVVVRCMPWRRRGGEIHMIIIHAQGEQRAEGRPDDVFWICSPVRSILGHRSRAVRLSGNYVQ